MALISWGVRHMDETTPHMHTITPVIYDERKTNTVILPGHVQSNGSKIAFTGFIKQRLEREFGFDVGVYENKREDERLLTNPLRVKG